MESSLNRATAWVRADWQPWVLSIVFLGFLSVFALALLPKMRQLLKGKPDNRFDRIGDRIGHTLKVAFGQSKMFKDSSAGWMHALIFWGFCVLLLRAGWFFAIGWFPAWNFGAFFGFALETGYAVLKDIFVSLVSLACCYGLYRRWVLKPSRLTLSTEGIVILILILMIMASDVVFEAAHVYLQKETAFWLAPLGHLLYSSLLVHLSKDAVEFFHNAAYWIHVLTILCFLTLLPRSKHFHILTSIPNVFLSHVTGRGNQLRRIDFEDENAESFGVTQTTEFTWKQLLDLHTCTECGRCDVFCPALKSGKPLSPKSLTMDLRDHLNAETPGLPTSDQEGFPGKALLGEHIQDETLWSCTTCGACEEECPVMIEYVNKVVDLRRGLVLTESRYPAELDNAFKSLETNSNPWGFGRDARADWAQGKDIKIWDPQNPSEYLYFVGCNGSFDHRGKTVTESVVALFKKANVDFAILGDKEGCTGDPARRLGNEYLFEMLALENVETFKENGIRKVVTHCPHCFNSLLNEYPDFGLKLEVLHHSELLAHLQKEGKLAVVSQAEESVVFHDSCYLGRHNKIYEAPRQLASSALVDSLQETENNRERGTCCGAGGGRFLLEEQTGSKMSHARLDELLQSGPQTIAVSCPFCVLMLEDGLKAKGLSGQVKVKDISELGG